MAALFLWVPVLLTMGQPEALSLFPASGRTGAPLRSKWPKTLYSSWCLLHVTQSFHKSFLSSANEVLGYKKSGTVPRDMLQVLPVTHHFSTGYLTVMISHQFLRRPRSQGLTVQVPTPKDTRLCEISLKPQEQPYNDACMIIPFIQRGKLRLREVTELPKSTLQ